MNSFIIPVLIPLSTTQYLDEKDPGAAMIPFSGALEQQLLDDPDNAKTYLEENKTQSCLSKIIVTGFKALGLQYFFTVGTDEVMLVFTRRYWFRGEVMLIFTRGTDSGAR